MEEALFIRSEFHARREGVVKVLKHQMIVQYGDRGRNITNLCTADYFDDLISYHNDNGREAFQKVYDLMVNKEAFALFVHSGMNKSSIKTEINQKVKQAVNFHIASIFIHGRGKTIINRILTVVKELEPESKFTSQVLFNEAKRGLIIVKLIV